MTSHRSPLQRLVIWLLGKDSAERYKECLKDREMAEGFLYRAEVYAWAAISKGEADISPEDADHCVHENMRLHDKYADRFNRSRFWWMRHLKLICPPQDGLYFALPDSPPRRATNDR